MKRKKLSPWQKKQIWAPPESNLGLGWHNNNGSWRWRDGELYNPDGNYFKPRKKWYWRGDAPAAPCNKKPGTARPASAMPVNEFKLRED